MGGIPEKRMGHRHILKKVGQYYTDKVNTHGATASGVDWNSTESQSLRFEELLEVREGDGAFSINDYGCGYGALIDYMEDANLEFEYSGFDVSETMISKARDLHPKMDPASFTTDESALTPSDYTVASGILNVKMDTPAEAWEEYVLATLDKLANLSKKGFAFNVLTSYSDPEYMRPDLYYADPCFLFDYCKTKYSKWVALAHDYGLYEFTILVKKRDEKSWLSL